MFLVFKIIEGDPEKEKRKNQEAIAGEGYISNKDQ